MLFSDDMRGLVLLFQRHGVEYAVCGGFAVAHYGFLRMNIVDLDDLLRAKRASARAKDRIDVEELERLAGLADGRPGRRPGGNRSEQ